MSTLNEVNDTFRFLIILGFPKRYYYSSLQYCISYAHERCKSKCVKNFKKFNTDFGYSDHTSGIEVPIAAAALGASIIEKHFTLDKTMIGPDHKASLNPIEFKLMVNSIRNIEKAIGSKIKKPTKK